jgi:hypothetical protein
MRITIITVLKTSHQGYRPEASHWPQHSISL